MRITRLRFWLSLAAFICPLAVFICAFSVFILLSGCGTFASHTNPIAGWQLEFKPEPQAIEKDRQDFLQKLPQEERKYAGWGNYYKDGKGQHAVEIEIPLNGTWWYYVLIYDKDNKRVKVYKYVAGHYMC